MLEQLGIAYAIGGSLASSSYGRVRFTQGADIAVEPFAGQAERFLDLVKGGFYVSREAMYQALDRRGSFNIIHLESAFKIDLFIRGDTEFERGVLARRRAVRLFHGQDRLVWFVSPEDIVLLKLRRHREGGEISDRQCQDVLGVLMVQGQDLDYGYLKASAGDLGLAELLEKALSQARE